jgi:formylglycine-generating enzyme required for sulfatase activity
MKKLLIVALLLNAGFLFAIWQQLSVVAEVGSGAGVSPCEGDPTQYSLDTNDDSAVDLSDFVYGLSWLFSGTEAPRVCVATSGDVEARLVALEQGAPPIAGFTFVETNAQGYPEYTHDSSGIRFVRLPGGSFEMGSPASETGRGTNEGPVHTVSLSPFLIAKYEVKQSEYEGVMGGHATLSATPSENLGSAPASDQRPVEQVSWDDLKNADGFLHRTGLLLPSEAQWEYACRAGTPGPYGGNGVLDDMGWYDSNSGTTTHEVGGKQANHFGLHDMHGNVFEWCEDVCKSDFYADDVPGFDPVLNSGSGLRVDRGGSFCRLARFARSAGRLGNVPSARSSHLGFRPARPLP